MEREKRKVEIPNDWSGISIQMYQKFQEVRKRNNKCWMDILRLAFKSNPEEAKGIFKHIAENDAKINKLSEELCE